MGPPGLAPQKCHNCRRRRLRCDRTLPSCLKCAATRQECLGYGKLFLWTGAVATRGKQAGRTSFAPIDPQSSPSSRGLACTPRTSSSSASSPISREIAFSPESSSTDADFTLSPFEDTKPLSLHFLIDPVVHDFDPPTRYYLNYYAEQVARDLVVYDIPHRNPFRNLVPLCRRHDFLQHIVVATAAVHQVSYLRSRGLPFQGRLYDALAARQKALGLIKTAIGNLAAHNYGDVLTAVVFLVNFELIDSGRDSWKAHVGAAGRLIALLQAAALPTTSIPATSLPLSAENTDSSISKLRDYIMSDCLTYFILGSTLGSWEGTGAAEVFGSLDVVSMLHRAEENTYHSCPAVILTAILHSSQLSARIHRGKQPRADDSGDEGEELSPAHRAEAMALMREMRFFDTRRWAEGITAAGQAPDGIAATEADVVVSREHMASAHRAAACAYLLMAVPGAFTSGAAGSADGGCEPYPSPEDFVSSIFHHLSCIHETDMLFKGTVWPTFIAGAQTADGDKREWVMQRLSKMWLSVCPWGYVRTAVETLQALWRFRDELAAGGRIVGDGGVGLDTRAPGWGRREWLAELKALKVDCLIV